jgi:hypothetical protein
MNPLRTLALLVAAGVVVVALGYAAFGAVLYSFDQSTYAANTTATYDYDAVMTDAKAAGYSVRTVDSFGFHPDGVEGLDAELGSDYEIVRVVYYHESGLELDLTVADGGRTELAVYDREFRPVGPERLPEAWLLERIQLALGVDEATAESYVAGMRAEAADRETPRTYAAERLLLAPIYAEFESRASPVVRAEGDGQGGVVYEYTTGNDDIGELRFVVGRAELSDRDGRWEYVLNLDRAGTIGVTIHGPTGVEVSEDELRERIRERFVAIGIPASAAEDLTFEYEGSVW